VTLLPLLALLSASPDAGALPALEDLRRDLTLASMAMDPCTRLAALLEQANARLDAQPEGAGDAAGFTLLGEILRVSDQAGCAAPSGSLARESRHASDSAAAFAIARALSPDAGADPSGPTWNGTLLERAGDARLARAKEALREGDFFAARRELVLLHADSVDAAMQLGDPRVEAALWRELRRRDHHAKATLSASTPEKAVRALEQAAIFGDLRAFEALLSRHSELRAALSGAAEGAPCAKGPGDPSTSLPCALLELLPEAPKEVACAPSAKSASAKCAVAGREGHREVLLVREGLQWRVEGSTAVP
jgi:hypothetical protein